FRQLVFSKYTSSLQASQWKTLICLIHRNLEAIVTLGGTVESSTALERIPLKSEAKRIDKSDGSEDNAWRLPVSSHIGFDRSKGCIEAEGSLSKFWLDPARTRAQEHPPPRRMTLLFR
ncbi:MAG TPA: hypothetical protein VIT18_03635, partial [Terrimicrobiaceae bacterium]